MRDLTTVEPPRPKAYGWHDPALLETSQKAKCFLR